MPPQPDIQKLVLVSIEDRETIELIRAFLEPLGYSVQFAPEAPTFETLVKERRLAVVALAPTRGR